MDLILYALLKNGKNKLTILEQVNQNSLDVSYSPINDFDMTTKKYVDDYRHDEINFKDSINGFNYTVRMENGQLISFCSDVVRINIESMPDKIEYLEGDAFDPTGMVVVAICADGSTREIENYIYPDIVTSSSVIITYGDCSTEFAIEMLYVKDLLIDFEYVANDDGTYTITGWKETLNGEPSTILSVPNSNNIIV